jgi:hypothetical protein
MWLNKLYNVPSVRCRLAPEVAQQHVIDVASEDLLQQNGPNTVQTVLCVSGIHIARYVAVASETTVLTLLVQR